MSEPTAVALSRHFSTLLNRRVEFKPSSAAKETKATKAYAVYKLFSENSALVVKADLVLFGGFAGALVGLPEADVRQRLNANPLDELLFDPMHEVLNIAASALSTEARAVFERVVFNPIHLGPNAEKALNTPMHRIYFNVEIEGYPGGSFCICE